MKTACNAEFYSILFQYSPFYSKYKLFCRKNCNFFEQMPVGGRIAPPLLEMPGVSGVSENSPSRSALAGKAKQRDGQNLEQKKSGCKTRSFCNRLIHYGFARGRRVSGKAARRCRDKSSARQFLPG